MGAYQTKFHRRRDRKPGRTYRLATWNVGGLRLPAIWDLCEILAETTPLRDVHVLLLQEVICDAGLQFGDRHKWKAIYGKKTDGGYNVDNTDYQKAWIQEEGIRMRGLAVTN